MQQGVHPGKLHANTFELQKVFGCAVLGQVPSLYEQPLDTPCFSPASLPLCYYSHPPVPSPSPCHSSRLEQRVPDAQHRRRRLSVCPLPAVVHDHLLHNPALVASAVARVRLAIQLGRAVEAAARERHHRAGGVCQHGGHALDLRTRRGRWLGEQRSDVMCVGRWGG
eukprot:365865-Chlamydomonas_euryale.AAC.9